MKTPAKSPHNLCIAVVGSGISGLASAYFLSRAHRVTLFESGAYFGGHTNTVDVTLNGVTHPVDTGFLVFNDRTYPNLIALFQELGVQSHPSDMSFSVSRNKGEFEWAGTSLDTLFAQRSKLFSPSFAFMIRDILRFNRNAESYLAQVEQSGCSLNELLIAGGYGKAFRDSYLLPMAGSIWSSKPSDILKFPAATFLRFCMNHALLQINDRPQWRTVIGGARDYVRRILEKLPDIRAVCPVRSIQRHTDGVEIRTDAGTEHFDEVVLATHAPTSLRLLSNPTRQENEVLGAIKYQHNLAVLHTDASLLPVRRKVWSAWNYLTRDGQGHDQPICVSYLLNQLQPIPFNDPVVVTLNPIQAPASSQVIARFDYEHPVFDLGAIQAQTKVPALQGQNHTWYAGAWTGYGFHEDGLKSALRIARAFGLEPAWTRL